MEDCLHSVIAVYSSNPQGPLSLLARVPRLLKGAAVEGVISTKRALRIPAMRRSIFVVPADNADAIFSATRFPEAVYTSILRRAGVEPEEYERLKREILLAAGLPKSIDQIRDAIREPPDELGLVLQYMCTQGDLLRIRSASLRSNELTYAATRVWIGRELRRGDQYEALIWLAGEYLRAFGPASVEDFTWWSGVPAARAEEAVRAHEVVDLGKGQLLHAKDERAFAGTRPHTGRVSLLPKWDCYTMGYAKASRARFVQPALLPLVYDSGGDALPMVLVEGRVRGTWSMRLNRDRSRIELQMFDTPGPKLRAAIEAEAELAANFLDAPRLVIEWSKVAKPEGKDRATRSGA